MNLRSTNVTNCTSMTVGASSHSWKTSLRYSEFWTVVEFYREFARVLFHRLYTLCCRLYVPMFCASCVQRQNYMYNYSHLLLFYWADWLPDRLKLSLLFYFCLLYFAPESLNIDLPLSVYMSVCLSVFLSVVYTELQLHSCMYSMTVEGLLPKSA